MKSKTLLRLRYRILYIALALVQYILISENWGYILLLPFFIVYIVKQHQKIVISIILVLLLYGFSRNYFLNQKIIDSDVYHIEVIKVTKKTESTSFIGKIDRQLVSIYIEGEISLIPGEIYEMKGRLEKPSNNTIPSSFNYRTYLLSKRVKYTVYDPKLTYVETTFNYNIISHHLSNYIDQKIPLSKSYVKTFILADKSDFDQDVIDQIKILGISHLFAVSGFHVALLVVALQKILARVTKNKSIITMVISIILCIYLTITSFAPSISRAVLMYFFLTINKKCKLKLSTIDILSLIFIILIVFRPFYYYNVGFVLSFLVTLSLLLSQENIAKHNQLGQLFLIGFISMVTTFPIIMNLNNQINLLSLLFNILFVIYMTYIILPLSYITFIFTSMDIINNTFVKMYNQLIYSTSMIDGFILKGAFINIYEIMIYYILMIYLFSEYFSRNRILRPLIMLTILVIVILNTNYINPTKKIVFIDVKGDATLITDSYNRCNILIDTGDADEYDAVLNYITSRNVKKLDYIIISHFHMDHYGEYQDIVQSINVKNTINKYNVESYQERLISCGSIKLYIYKLTYDDNNENNNSIILSLFVNDKHYLFTGDSEIEREKDFMESYSPDIDYIKIAHHGSNTSTTEEFINHLQPSAAFIIVKRHNIHNHPDNIVIDRLTNSNIDIYRTDEFGSIEITYLFNKEIKKFHSP